MLSNRFPQTAPLFFIQSTQYLISRKYKPDEKARRVPIETEIREFKWSRMWEASEMASNVKDLVKRAVPDILRNYRNKYS